MEDIKQLKLEQWGPGEWIDEPDSLFWYYKETLCRIRRLMVWEGPNNEHLSMGQLNGYIQLPAHHPWVFQDPFEIDCDVHGGITFGGPDEKGDYWIGFDCAHSGDIVPSHKDIGENVKKEMVERFPFLSETLNASPIFESHYRNIDYVKKECESLVDQMLEAKHE
jgi:hypothetical protein